MNISHVNIKPNQLKHYVSNMRADQPIKLIFKGQTTFATTTAYEIYQDGISTELVVTDSYAEGSTIRIYVEWG